MLPTTLHQLAVKKNKLFGLFWLFLICLILTSCQITQPKKITGVAFETMALAYADVRLLDAQGKVLQGKTDIQGRYSLSLKGISAPVLISVSTANQDKCADNSQLRPICLAAYINNFSNKSIQIANINPLTDRVVSDIAVSKGFIGPQQWVDSNIIGEVDQESIDQALSNLRKGFGDALEHIGIANVKSFNPATYPAYEHTALSSLLSLIHHNRNYDNNSGKTGHTTLTDAGFRPIVGLSSSGDYEPLDFIRAKNESEKIQSASRRIFIIGDSTSAVYEKYRFPRMGWGQSLAEKFSLRQDIAIVVASRAGRSSRDFYNGRWFAQIESLIQPGDYLFIAFGHNDQNCDASKPLRGLADVKNLCTYPNAADGSVQFPEGKSELSFEHSLTRYIDLARQKSAIPILVTPSTRIKDAQGLQQTPVVPSHITKQHAQSGYWATGDYAQTIKELAKKYQVPLLDLEQASRDFANSMEKDVWKNYWLVVDSRIYPFYKNQPGSIEIPDGTHFQKNGADKMAELILQSIKENSETSSLSKIIFI